MVEMAVVFTGLMALVLVSSLLVNNYFLESYYVRQLEKSLKQAYTELDGFLSAGNGSRDEYSTRLSRLITSNNISLMVLDEQFEKVAWIRDEDADTLNIMSARLFGYFWGIDQQKGTVVLDSTDSYTIQKYDDSETDLEYLEMWGTMESGYHFMMRIPMLSIRSSVRISNEFTMYLSVAAIVLCVGLIIWMSHKITTPLLELTTLSQRMAELDFDARYERGGSNEIGILGEHFNQMSDTLERTISQLKTANNELQKDIEKKTQIDEMRKEFLSNVSHELKTPIALIQGYAEGLKECVNDDEESREFYCDVIMDESSKMNVLVQKLMTLNQLEFGNDEVVMERFDLIQLIRGKLQSSQILAQQSQAELRYFGPDKANVWADEFKTEEVLNNFLSNALHYVSGEKRIEVRVEEREGVFRTSVFNTGERIPEEDLDKIWTKFYKVDKARSREYGGSGVGLAIVKAIMDGFHQPFGVENRPDGVEFWFELESADKRTGQEEE